MKAIKTKRIRTFSDAFRLYIENQEKFKLKNGKLNVSAISEQLGVTPRTVTKMIEQERYSPREDMLIRIAESFDVSLYEITGFIPFDFEKKKRTKSTRKMIS